MTSNIQPSGNRDWSAYYKATQDRPARPLLLAALKHVTSRNKAIDIGGGALNDTRHLLSEGFEVTVIDKSPSLTELAAALPSDHLKAVVTSYEDFDFGTNHYDIASAMFALPFNPPESFVRVFESIKESLAQGGIFCGQFFGVNDEWSSDEKMTFQTRKDIDSLLSGMEVIKIDEKEEDGVTAIGNPKHWHIFHVIAKKQ